MSARRASISSFVGDGRRCMCTSRQCPPSEFLLSVGTTKKNPRTETQSSTTPLTHSMPLVFFPITRPRLWAMYKTQEALMWTKEELDLCDDEIDALPADERKLLM